MSRGAGTKESPWVLTTPPGSSEYEMYRDESADPPALVCVVGKTPAAHGGARARRARAQPAQQPHARS